MFLVKLFARTQYHEQYMGGPVNTLCIQYRAYHDSDRYQERRYAYRNSAVNATAVSQTTSLQVVTLLNKQ